MVPCRGIFADTRLPFFIAKKKAIASGEKHWRDKNPIAEKRVLKRIQQEGPLRAKDFENEGTKKGTG